LPQVVMLEDDEFDAFLWIVAQSPEKATLFHGKSNFFGGLWVLLAM
jgi:hypothetical protein